MVKERIKTVLLVSLVIVSMFLTQQLWIDFPYQLLPSFGQEVDEKFDHDVMLEVVSPEKYLINFGSNKTILYSEEGYNLWGKSRRVLKQVFSDMTFNTAVIGKEELNKIRTSRYIELYFPKELPTYIFPKIFQLKDANAIYNNVTNIKSVIIPLNGDNLIVFNDGNQYIKVNDINYDTTGLISDLAKIQDSDYTRYYTLYDKFEVESQAYFPINVKPAAPIAVKNEINLEHKEKIDSIAQGFFDVDLDYVRRMEDNGTVIYVYKGNEVLTFSHDGLITYLNTLDQEMNKRDFYKSLKTAVSFITNKIGWPGEGGQSGPEAPYLEDIREIEVQGNKGYRFTFSYRMGGRPIILNKNNLSHPMQIEVFNNEVKSFKRYVRELGNPNSKIGIELKPIMRPLEVIKKNYAFIKEDFKMRMGIREEDLLQEDISDRILASIDDIYLAFLDKSSKKDGEELVSVLVIDVAGTKYMFNIADGTYQGTVGGRIIIE